MSSKSVNTLLLLAVIFIKNNICNTFIIYLYIIINNIREIFISKLYDIYKINRIYIVQLALSLFRVFYPYSKKIPNPKQLSFGIWSP